MNIEHYFKTEEQARAFALGLSNANKGDIHSIKWEACAPYDGYGFRVVWNDEDRKPSELPEENCPLSPAEYVVHKGAVCPVCRGRDITGDAIEVDERHCYQPVSCLNPDCEASWIDCYELSGYDNLER